MVDCVGGTRPVFGMILVLIFFLFFSVLFCFLMKYSCCRRFLWPTFFYLIIFKPIAVLLCLVLFFQTLSPPRLWVTLCFPCLFGVVLVFSDFSVFVPFLFYAAGEGVHHLDSAHRGDSALGELRARGL